MDGSPSKTVRSSPRIASRSSSFESTSSGSSPPESQESIGTAYSQKSISLEDAGYLPLPSSPVSVAEPIMPYHGPEPSMLPSVSSPFASTVGVLSSPNFNGSTTPTARRVVSKESVPGDFELTPKPTSLTEDMTPVPLQSNIQISVAPSFATPQMAPSPMRALESTKLNLGSPLRNRAHNSVSMTSVAMTYLSDDAFLAQALGVQAVASLMAPTESTKAAPLVTVDVQGLFLTSPAKKGSFFDNLPASLEMMENMVLPSAAEMTMGNEYLKDAPEDIFEDPESKYLI